MHSLTDFLAGLPGIMPIKARRLILEGDLLSKVERADIQSRNRRFLDLVLEVGPDAAAAILVAYKQGRLPMKRGKVPTDARAAGRQSGMAGDGRHVRLDCRLCCRADARR